MAIEVFFAGNKKVNATIEGYTVTTDQPVQAGGDATSPTPFSLFLASIGTCAGIYVKGFCDQRGIDSSDIRLTMDYEYDPIKKMILKILIDIIVPAGFPAQYDEAVMRTASLCAVKRHLHPDIGSQIRVIRLP